MKTLFLFRESYDSQYILSQLASANIIDSVILESGKKAKKAKLKRFFANIPLYKYPKKIIDLIALIIYSNLAVFFMKKKLGKFDYPKNYIRLTTEDANNKDCIDYILNYKPDIIFIYGTAILKKNFLKKVKVNIFNIHSGILPYYRNVHSDYWAFINKDYSKIGVSVIYLDAGIDSGDIAIQKTIKYCKNDSIVSIKVKNLQLVVEQIFEVIKKKIDGNLPRKEQDKLKVCNYSTPTFVDLLKIFIEKNQ
jgi:folate-dependent phosphoribosylglycinamide formyltransferase PurN